MLNLKDKGFINYFGMQRFGTHSIATHDIGIQILKGDWKNAVDLIVGSRDQDSPSVQEARKMWTENQDAKGAARKFPRRCVAERSVMIYFDKKGRHTDFFGAITSVSIALIKFERNYAKFERFLETCDFCMFTRTKV
jgi:tRNA pseudouridine13 synthase